MRIDYDASDDVRRLIAAIGRTEDISFSPSSRRLAIAGAGRDIIAILDIEISATSASPVVRVTGALEIASPCFRYPHGLEFINETTLAVGSRFSGVAVFALPPPGNAVHACALEPLHVLVAGPDGHVGGPGSLAIVRRNPCELLICNNFRHTITRHVLAPDAKDGKADGEVVLSKWLDVPDGIDVSSDGRWIAVSNHWTHGVLVYENKPSLTGDADPDGILRSLHYPHGVRFSADGRHVFVADAGAPYVHIYASDDGDWRGVRSPIVSFKVMDDAAFLRGHVNAQDGGPKGVDLDRTASVLVVTSEHQPLAFFDLAKVLRAGTLPDPSLGIQVELGAMELATGWHRQLYRTWDRFKAAEAEAARERKRAVEAEARAALHEERAAKFKAKAEKAKAKAARRKGWIVAPISRLYSAIKRPN